MEGEDRNTQLQSIKTSFKIVHSLQEIGPARLSEIADHQNLAESTTHRHLQTLCELRYVSRKKKMYQIGLRFVRLGQAAKAREIVYQKVQPYLRMLAKDTGERVQFIAEDHGLGTYLYIESGEKAVQVGFDVGRQIHLHCSSAGKMILSSYDRSTVDEIIDRWGLPSHTKNTISDREEFYNELDHVREQGYAFNREEHVKGVHGTAVPIKDENFVYGAVSIAGPSSRLVGDWFETELPNKLLAAANELELNIIYSEENDSIDHIVE